MDILISSGTKMREKEILTYHWKSGTQHIYWPRNNKGLLVVFLFGSSLRTKVKRGERLLTWGQKLSILYHL